MSKSKIEWTEETWNPVTGCTRVSEGCDNCYAVTMTKRLAGIQATKEKYSGLVNENKNHFNGRIKLHPDELSKPLSWRKPRLVFVNSMSDLFHPDVPFEFIGKAFAVMALAEKHTFQLLTKRPERACEFFRWAEERFWDLYPDWNTQKYKDPIDSNCVLQFLSDEETDIPVSADEFAPIWPLPNTWLGTSVENQEAADDRIPHLLKCPAAVRFLSCEPLLGEISLSPNIPGLGRDNMTSWLHYGCTESRIDWVIVGGESGKNARPMHPDWARSIRDQCQEAGVSFFFKQWGKWVPSSHYPMSEEELLKIQRLKLTPTKVYKTHELMVGIGKSKAGRLLDGQEWNEIPGGYE